MLVPQLALRLGQVRAALRVAATDYCAGQVSKGYRPDRHGFLAAKEKGTTPQVAGMGAPISFTPLGMPSGVNHCVVVYTIGSFSR